MNVPHGLDFHDGSFWVIDGADRLVQRIDAENGRVQEIWVFGPNDPDPHGMCIHDNHVYFTDAGLGGGRKPSAGTKPQMIFRFPLTRTVDADCRRQMAYAAVPAAMATCPVPFAMTAHSIQCASISSIQITTNSARITSSSALVGPAVFRNGAGPSHAVVQVQQRRREKRHEQAADDRVDDDHLDRLAGKREWHRRERHEHQREPVRRARHLREALALFRRHLLHDAVEVGIQIRHALPHAEQRREHGGPEPHRVRDAPERAENAAEHLGHLRHGLRVRDGDCRECRTPGWRSS